MHDEFAVLMQMTPIRHREVEHPKKNGKDETTDDNCGFHRDARGLGLHARRLHRALEVFAEFGGKVCKDCADRAPAVRKRL